MHPLDPLLQQNLAWSREVHRKDPEFFSKLSRQQAPAYLWIGCSDSRVPANEICGLLPGEIFVHRNVANIVVHSDLNCLSVMQYAIDVLKVKHIIVCGHYGCGGVRAVVQGQKLGLIDNWIAHVRDVKDKHDSHLTCIADESDRVDRLCELNVVEQVIHAAQTSIVQQAWKRGEELSIHGWVYGLKDGLVRYLDITLSSEAELDAATAKKWADHPALPPIGSAV